jgi:hypothetical protein
MRQGTTLHVSPADRRRLEAVVADRNSPQKHVWRVKVALAAADGTAPPRSGAARACLAPPSGAGASGSRKRASPVCCGTRARKPGKAPLPTATVDRVVEMTLADPPGERRTGPAA